MLYKSLPVELDFLDIGNKRAIELGLEEGGASRSESQLGLTASGRLCCRNLLVNPKFVHAPKDRHHLLKELAAGSHQIRASKTVRWGGWRADIGVSASIYGMNVLSDTAWGT